MSTPQSYGRQQDKGRRHLLDLNAPRPVTASSLEDEDKRLTNVQRWVMSTIAVTTLLHMSGAAILGAVTMDDLPMLSYIGLAVVAGAFGVMSVASWLGIHGKSIMSPWLLLGLLPTPLCLWLTLM